MIDRKTFNERLASLPLEYQMIFFEDLEGTIEAHLTVLECAIQKEKENHSLCETQKSKGYRKLNSSCTVNFAEFPRTHTRAKAKIEEVRA